MAIPYERAAAVRDALMEPAAYSGWGVRTLGSQERAFNPVGYHTGAVWPHDIAMTAVGLRKYGFDPRLPAHLRRPPRDGSDLLGLPPAGALLRGLLARRPRGPDPVSRRLQSPGVGGGRAALHTDGRLGLVPDGLRGILRIRRPSLPRLISRLELRGLRVAGSRVDLVFERVASTAA